MAFNHEFLHLYYALTHLEHKQFASYIRRCYSGKKKMLSIITYLKSTKGNRELFCRVTLVKKLKLKKDNNKIYGTLLSEMNKICREWMLYEAYQKDDAGINLLLLSKIHQRYLEKETYKKWSNKVEQSLEQAAYVDDHHYYLCWQQKHLAAYDNTQHHIENTTKEQLLNQAEQKLDSFYALVKLRYFYERIIIARLKNTDKNVFSTTAAGRFASQHLGARSPLIRFYANIILAERSDDYQFYETAFSILSTCDHEIAPAVLSNFYCCLSNFAIKNFNEQNGPQRLFYLQTTGLERGWISAEQVISCPVFLNLINVAAMVGAVKRARSIVAEYGIQLPEADRKSCLEFAEARILFAEKNFHQAIKLLDKPDKYWTFELAVIHTHALRVRCFYELRNEGLNEAHYVCEKFYKKIRQLDCLSPAYKRSYLNFGDTLRKFYYKKTEWKQLASEVKYMKGIACKHWLEEKIAEQL